MLKKPADTEHSARQRGMEMSLSVKLKAEHQTGAVCALL